MARTQKLPEGHPDYTILHSPSKHNSVKCYASTISDITYPNPSCVKIQHQFWGVKCPFKVISQDLDEAQKPELPWPLLSPPCLHQSGPYQWDKVNGLADSLSSPSYSSVLFCASPVITHHALLKPLPQLRMMQRKAVLTKPLECISQQKNSSAHRSLTHAGLAQVSCHYLTQALPSSLARVC